MQSNEGRIIKFRAWDKNLKEMHGWDLITKLDPPLSALLHPIYELMQYTGRKDKNGKEIYEGDIIKDCNGLDVTWVVTWCNKEACFLGLDWCGKPNEVIGNIYESPHLLDNSS